MEETKYFFCERQLNLCYRCETQCKYCKELDDEDKNNCSIKANVQ